MQEDKEKAVREICDVMRRKGGVEWRSAVVHEERKEYFRGKDMQRFFEAGPDRLDGISEIGWPSDNINEFQRLSRHWLQFPFSHIAMHM